MLRVQGLDWYVGTSQYRDPCARHEDHFFVEFSLSLTPSYKNVTVPTEEFVNRMLSVQNIDDFLNMEAMTKTVELMPVKIQCRVSVMDFDRFGLMNVARTMTRDLSQMFIKQNIANGFIEALPSRNRIELRETVAQHMISYLQTMKCDDLTSNDDVLDVSQAIVETFRQNYQMEIEQELLRRQAYETHLQDIRLHQRFSSQAEQKSKELLFKYLSGSQKEEYESNHRITIKNGIGTFIVKSTGNRLVDRFNENGDYICSYCVMFANYGLPEADTLLMKVAFLKNNPEKFLKIANKFVTKPSFSVTRTTT